MTFDLDLWPTDLSIDKDHLLIKDFIPTKCSWVAQGVVDGYDIWPWALTYWLKYWEGSSTYQFWSLWSKAFLGQSTFNYLSSSYEVTIQKFSKLLDFCSLVCKIKVLNGCIGELEKGLLSLLLIIVGYRIIDQIIVQNTTLSTDR